MAKSVLEIMDEESDRASQQKNRTAGPVFLRLKDRQKALIRPLFNLNGCVVMAMHNKYNQASPKDGINAVCAQEVGVFCEYCQTAVDHDKKLTAGTSFMLPVYVYKLAQLTEDNKTWVDLTYTDSEGKEQPVSGLRVLELTAFGTIKAVLDAFRTHYREEGQDITACDYILERKGAYQQTSYTVMPKTPKAMHAEVKATIPTPDAVRQMVIAACPPPGTNGALPGTGPAAPANGHADEEVPEF